MKHVPDEMAEVFLSNEKTEEEKEREEKRTIDHPNQYDSGVIVSDGIHIEEVTMHDSDKVRMLVLLDDDGNAVAKIPRCFDIDGIEEETEETGVPLGLSDHRQQLHDL